MNRYYHLNKSDYLDFLTYLLKYQKLVAPVDLGYDNFSFREIANVKDVVLHYKPTVIPPKKYLLPKCEIIQQFDIGKNEWDPVIDFEPATILGIHTCDLAAIECLNLVFSQDPQDMNFIKRRDSLLLIGYECCDYCDQYAMCALMRTHKPSAGYDLMISEFSDYYIFHVGTAAGEQLIKSSKLMTSASDVEQLELCKLHKMKEETFINDVHTSYESLSDIFDKGFFSQVWHDLELKCLSCGNCTNVCPSCYCFDIEDDIDLDLKNGFRYRKWDSCQNEEFAQVAGGENFRKSRADRQRHRCMRKFVYPMKKFNRYFCTGCGRCSRACMAGIYLKDIISKLAEEADGWEFA